MGEVIKMREQYEVLRYRMLRKYSNCDQAEYRVKLANDLSRLAKRWGAIVRHSGLSLCQRNEDPAASPCGSDRPTSGRRRGKWSSL